MDIPLYCLGLTLLSLQLVLFDQQVLPDMQETYSEMLRCFLHAMMVGHHCVRHLMVPVNMNSVGGKEIWCWGKVLGLTLWPPP